MTLAPSHRFDGDTQIQGSLDVSNQLTINGVAISASGGIPAGTVTDGGLWWNGSAWVNAKVAAANITAGVITNTEISTSAAIADSKLAITDRSQEPYGPYPPGLMTVALAFTSQHARGMRYKIPKTGSINAMMVFTNAPSGNIDLGIYDCAATTRNLLRACGITASSVTAGFQSIALSSPLSVVAGDQVDLVAWADNGTVTFGRWSTALSNNQSGPMPAGYMGGAGSPRVCWDYTVGAGGLPGNLTEASFAVAVPVGIWVKYA